MEFRYQEVFTWFIPGFFLMLYLLIEASFLFTENGGDSGVWDFINGLKDGPITFLVFAIPFVSLILGGIFNGCGGYLFRHFFKWPIYNAYAKLLEDKKIELGEEALFKKKPIKADYKNKIEDYKEDIKNFRKEAERYFDDSRDIIDLEPLDRYYYRYVYSRNMFVTQIFLLMASSVMVVCAPARSWLAFLIAFFISALFLFVFGSMVNRDLSTHVKQVLLKRNAPESTPNSKK